VVRDVEHLQANRGIVMKHAELLAQLRLKRAE
jgi:hypothetical protein